MIVMAARHKRSATRASITSSPLSTQKSSASTAFGLQPGGRVDEGVL
jgi:hypothetical protein